MQLELPIGGPAPNARTTDPISSHLANHSIRNNKTLVAYVIEAVNVLSRTQVGVTDDDILEYVETATQRRQQRNNLARTRGLLERDGWFARLPDKPRVTVIPIPKES